VPSVKIKLAGKEKLFPLLLLLLVTTSQLFWDALTKGKTHKIILYANQCCNLFFFFFFFSPNSNFNFLL
jgi:hypothetical protein